MKMVCEIWRKEPIAPSYQQEEALTSYTWAIENRLLEIQFCFERINLSRTDVTEPQKTTWHSFNGTNQCRRTRNTPRMKIALHYFLAILAPTVPIIQKVNITCRWGIPWLLNSPWCRNYLLHLLVLSPVFQASQIKQQAPKYTSERSNELSSIHNIHLGLNSW